MGPILYWHFLFFKRYFEDYYKVHDLCLRRVGRQTVAAACPTLAVRTVNTHTRSRASRMQVVPTPDAVSRL